MLSRFRYYWAFQGQHSHTHNLLKYKSLYPYTPTHRRVDTHWKFRYCYMLLIVGCHLFISDRLQCSYRWPQDRDAGCYWLSKKYSLRHTRHQKQVDHNIMFMSIVSIHVALRKWSSPSHTVDPISIQDFVSHFSLSFVGVLWYNLMPSVRYVRVDCWLRLFTCFRADMLSTETA